MYATSTRWHLWGSTFNLHVEPALTITYSLQRSLSIWTDLDDPFQKVRAEAGAPEH